MNTWIDDQVDRLIGNYMNRQKDISSINVQIDRLINTQVDRLIERQVDKKWIAKQVDRLIDRWMNR